MAPELAASQSVPAELDLECLGRMDLLDQLPAMKAQELPQPESFKGTLRPYQLRGLQWLAFLDRHLDRLFEGAKAIAMDIGLSREELARRIYETLDANRMEDGAHIRLMVTRGVRSTPYQDPRVVVTPATVVIIAEYKEPPAGLAEKGLRLVPLETLDTRAYRFDSVLRGRRQTMFENKLEGN